jgi:hypothetical protein
MWLLQKRRVYSEHSREALWEQPLLWHFIVTMLCARPEGRPLKNLFAHPQGFCLSCWPASVVEDIQHV